ncbi:MAG TPA: hypothetical protein ENH62_09975 [Marinobacter sp.]|uniref:Uncharacterized protein n=1 Tax=marine sediment metagenome TaxID=412755 RepID=A0A0F9PFX3_9ZZZZ|nr:hypothetical protein [Marinobacter sp.]
MNDSAPIRMRRDNLLEGEKVLCPACKAEMIRDSDDGLFYCYHQRPDSQKIKPLGFVARQRVKRRLRRLERARQRGEDATY